ncbi:MAG: hypothetical protein J6Y44_00870, partial [Clostridia bacterium]|nr:hypothetical protein [Clostridia bacterium]
LGDAVDELYVGQVMGYAKYDAVTGEELDDYADAGVWKKGGAVADELIGVLADYKISTFGEDGFTTTLTNDIFANVSVGTFFDTSAPGFMSLVDPDWKLNELEDGLNASIQTAVIEQLIDFGAFGDYYAITDGRTASSTETDSYVDTDELFVLIGSTTAAEAREYWLNLTMSEYMSSLMTYMVSIKDFFTANPAIAAQYAAWVANP